jgi:hypothetical protein
MKRNNAKRWFPYGIRHEVAKRWPIWDWYRSSKVAKRINSKSADKMIFDLINSNQPALVGRLGGTEARFLGEFKKIKSVPFCNDFLFSIKPNWKRRSKEVNVNAGFYFQNIGEVAEFNALYEDALYDTNIIGAWGTAFSHIESDFIDRIPEVVPVGMTAPWVKPYVEQTETFPWAAALRGKKVLVISPFVDTIQKQFIKINHVFPDSNLHQFKLITLKSPVTLSMKFPVVKSWFDLFYETKIEMSKIDYDIALVSAGSYSYPLAHFAKIQGKIGIHSGGGLQLFFGIMGKRWENSVDLLNIANDNWTRPSLEETPDSAHLVENGCYW